MAKYSSNKTTVNASCSEVYNFMSDFNNFEKLMPPQVHNWESDTDKCSFKIEGLSNFSMKIINKKENNRISIASFGNNPVDYYLDVFFEPVDDNSCKVLIEFDAELNSFMRMMADKPLKNFVNMLAEKLKELYQ